ncbi:SCO family protein [Cytobacillus gottheilii]|uniref:SCO family protein n=1 Tax=Cytobacillus gottheilii TaxID=859144 RepID=UPI0015D5B7FD|nr:SCO family protein [Cytobacillus gottheilii]
MLFILSILILSACSTSFEAETDWKVQSFEYTNQNNEKVSLNDYKGDIWLADFIFTNCETVCPPMTYNLSQIQQKLTDEGLDDIKFVSFSVDPKVDSPEILKEYIEKYDVNLENWDLLTGYTQDVIETFAMDSFKTVVVKDNQSDQVNHGTSFYLVNKEGTVVKNYSGVQNVPFDQIVSDIKSLSNSYK